MKIKELDKREITDSNKGLITAFSQFDNLLTELKKMELPEDIAFTINIEIEKINGVTDSDKMLRKQIRSSQTSIIKLIEKQLKLVTRNYYRNTWMVLGMAIGAGMDKKALKEGRQLDIEIKN